MIALDALWPKAVLAEPAAVTPRAEVAFQQPLVDHAVADTPTASTPLVLRAGRRLATTVVAMSDIPPPPPGGMPPPPPPPPPPPGGGPSMPPMGAAPPPGYQPSPIYPAYAGQQYDQQQRYASFGARLGAFIIDGLVSLLFELPAIIVFSAGPRERRACTVNGERGTCNFPTGSTVALGVLLAVIGGIAFLVIFCKKISRSQSWGMKATGITSSTPSAASRSAPAERSAGTSPTCCRSSSATSDTCGCCGTSASRRGTTRLPGRSSSRSEPLLSTPWTSPPSPTI